ncbi:hypothetical protein EV363DRAFT_1275576 [Boletus edulis]|nr:hypothetical protein EV363DRAFT_1275576 [Boletus edulis]
MDFSMRKCEDDIAHQQRQTLASHETTHDNKFPTQNPPIDHDVHPMSPYASLQLVHDQTETRGATPCPSWAPGRFSLTQN